VLAKVRLGAGEAGAAGRLRTRIRRETHGRFSPVSRTGRIHGPSSADARERGQLDAVLKKFPSRNPFDGAFPLNSKLFLKPILTPIPL
jgi:hypothetical protein